MLEEVRRLSAPDEDLAALWRATRAGRAGDAVRVRYPDLGTGVIRVDLGPSHGALEISHPDVRDTPLEVEGDARVQRAAAPATDLVVVGTGDRLEELALLHDSTAPARVVWQVEAGPQIADVRRVANGALELIDRGGRAAARIPQPFAVDAQGVRRRAGLHVEPAGAGWRVTTTLDTRGLSWPVLLDPAVESVWWDQVSLLTGREHAGIAFDSGRGVVTVFGGYDGRDYLSDTWEWDGAAWTQRAPATVPTARAYHGMAYDAARGRTVLFGGIKGINQFLGETWEWDGADWTQRFPPASPTARQKPALAYDAQRARLVLYGGTRGAGVYPGDLWEWNGTTWTDVTPSGAAPSARSEVTLSYAGGGKTLLFGGLDGATKGDTWIWNGTTWSKPSGAAPSPRRHAAAAYDSARGRVVLYGGNSAPGDDTWEWDGAAWSNVGTAGPPGPRDAHLIAYDAARSRSILFGGGKATSLPADTWAYDGVNWSSAALAATPPASSLPLAYAASSTHVRLPAALGTWDFDGTRWTQVSAAAGLDLSSYALAYDEGAQSFVAFGGLRCAPSCVAVDETWISSSGPWSEVPVTGARPPARDRAAATYDVARSRVVLFGGQGAGSTLDDTWEWATGAWTLRTSVHRPPARLNAVLSYDRTRHVSVLYGGNDYAVSRVYADTWEWDGSDWTERQPQTSPPARQLASLTFDRARGRSVLFGGFDGTNLHYNDTWEWDGSDWQQRAASRAPRTRDVPGLAFDPQLGRAVLYGGSLGSAYSDTWTYHARGGACATGATCDSGFCVDGACCEAASCGSCQTCAGSSPGICTAVTDAVDADSCSGTSVCSASGVCGSALGQPCTAASTCASGFCADGVCCNQAACDAPCTTCAAVTSPGTCSAVTSTQDPDTCAGTSTCDASGACKAVRGEPCLVSGDCASAFCADGVCCDGACAGNCQACSAAAKGAGADGVCDDVADGADPRGDCPDDGVASCQRDGACDGAGGCRRYAKDSVCGVVSCTANQLSGSTCDGLGACVAGSVVTCAPYLCAAQGCTTSCTVDGECASDAYCAAGECLPRLANGAACTQQNQCQSALCADGVCCNAPCTGQCEACDVAGGEGACVPVSGAPHGARAACPGAAAGEPCSAASCNGAVRESCAGFVGPLVECRASDCVAGVETLRGLCDGTGRCPDAITGACQPYVCGADRCLDACASDDDCAAGFRCDGVTCVRRETASCDGDHTLVSADGSERTDCAPYRCDASGACKPSCAATSDCVAPALCDAAGRCVAPSRGAGESGGCGCRVPAHGAAPSAWLASVVLAVVAFGRRRTREPR